MTEGNDRQEKKILLDKKLEVAPTGSLGGSQIVNENGTNVSKSILMWCDVCGGKLEINDSVICKIDNKKACKDCVVYDDQKKVCIDCYKERHPLSKQEYKVLIMMARVVPKGEIHDITKISKSDIKKSVKAICSAGYMSKKFWTGEEVTDKGLEVIGCYRKIYRNDEDIAVLEGFGKVENGVR
ncbi:MAG: hypothetical protein EPO62_05245 [Candidatus Nitrosotenuis sp.]|nr:MAG: hypothetical protein EPO62_05245 [Candidatus Nitrosotenuis sp.]